MLNNRQQLLSLGLLLLALYRCRASQGGVRYAGGDSGPVQFGGFQRFARQAPEMINTTERDNHVYYTSTFHPPASERANQFWFDLASREDIEIIPESGISQSFRVFDTVDLPFTFPFYGHTIDSITVTTGGFLYTSDYLHSMIHLTQYIAPLQADFGPSLNDSARVLIYSGDDRFTVQWDGVHAADHVEDGTFTFQVSLFSNGTIHFVYRNMPLRISDISDASHPVEVGVADSFYVDTPIPPNLIRRQVFEYSRIQLQFLQDDLNFSAYILDPVPGCVTPSTCDECAAAAETSPFSCGWCSELNRCSDGFDRFRQDWLEAGCHILNSTSCELPTAAPEDLAQNTTDDPCGDGGVCPSFFVSSEFQGTCSGRGVCTSCGTCLCFGNSFGEACQCSDEDCPNACSGNGLCTCGAVGTIPTCECDTINLGGTVFSFFQSSVGNPGNCMCNPANCYDAEFPGELCHNVVSDSNGSEFCRCNQCLCPSGLIIPPGRNICIPQTDICQDIRDCARCRAGDTAGRNCDVCNLHELDNINEIEIGSEPSSFITACEELVDNCVYTFFVEAGAGGGQTLSFTRTCTTLQTTGPTLQTTGPGTSVPGRSQSFSCILCKFFTLPVIIFVLRILV